LIRKVKHFAVVIAVVVGFGACGGSVPANSADTSPADRTKDVLVTLEKSGYQAWQSKAAMFWDSFLSDKFVGFGSAGKLDKASAAKEYQGLGCEIQSFQLSDEQMRMLGPDAALLTLQVTVDGSCEGKKVPATSRVASVYLHDGDRWKVVFHSESPVVDPTALSAKPAAHKEAPEAGKDAAHDAGAEQMLAVERVVWEDWRKHDSKKLAKLTTRDISFINIFGTYLGTKATALKDWSGAGCDIKSVGFQDVSGTMLSPTVGILTFTATADGTCYGQVPPPIWGSSIYVKEADTWKWTFGINTPARR
jgi:hypothetical protein